MTIYKAKKSYILGNATVFLVIILVLTMITLNEGQAAQKSEWIGLGGFWLIGIILTLIPLAFRLEIGDDYVKSYFLGFLIKNLHPSDIQTIEYKNLLRGGLGYGKGLIIGAIINGKYKTLSMGEKFYGKEAIEHVRQALGNK